MKAEELVTSLYEAEPTKILESLRSYGLACAMKERERCAGVADEKDETGAPAWPDGEEIADAIRSRPVGDELMKEIEG